VRTFFKNVKKVVGRTSIFRALYVLRLVHEMTIWLDRLERKVQTIRAYEVNHGETTRAWERIQLMFDRVYTVKGIREAYRHGVKMLEQIPQRQVEEQNRIRIGIVGEIYVVMEDSINMKMEQLLNSLGAEVERSQYLSQWIAYNILPQWLNRTHERKVTDRGAEYLPVNIGGHAKQTVGQIIDFSQRGFDGVVHLMPFGCLPELVSQSIVPKIQEDYHIPVLTISLDEQTGLANNQTRVEAFLDLVRGKSGKMETVTPDDSLNTGPSGASALARGNMISESTGG